MDVLGPRVNCFSHPVFITGRVGQPPAWKVRFLGRALSGRSPGVVASARDRVDAVSRGPEAHTAALWSEVERWGGRDELALGLEGPVWDRYGEFVGHRWIRGTVTWTLADRRILIARERGGEAFEEALA